MGDGFTQADIDAGRLTYDHDGSESTADRFGFVLTDAAGASAGAGVLGIVVRPVNDHVPLLRDVNGLANQVNENTPAGTAVGVTVRGSDADAGTVVTYRLSSNPGGAFAIDADTGVVTLAGPLDRELLGPSLLLEVTGLSSDGGSAVMQFQVAIGDVNEAPAGADRRVTASEDLPYAFAVADVGFMDPDAGDRLGAVRIEVLPAVGVLSLAGVPVLAGQVIDAARWGELVYTPPAQASGEALATLLCRVADASGLEAGAARSITLDVRAVNDAPQLLAAQLTLVAGESLLLGPAQLAASDVDSPAEALLFQVSGLVNGRFESVAQPGVAIGSFTQADVQSGQVRFVATSASAAPAFALSVSDGTAASREVVVTVRFNSAPPVPTPDAPGPVPAPVPPGSTPAPTLPKGSAVQESGGTKSPGSTVERDDGAGRSLQAQVLAQPVRPALADEAAAPRPVRTDGAAAAAVRHDGRGGAGAAAPDAGVDGHGVGIEALLDAGWEFDVEDDMVDPAPDAQGLGGLRRSGRGAAAALPAGSEDEAEAPLMLSAEVAQAASVVLTAGSVWWALRAGGLVTSLMGALPAWRHVDLLAVLPDDDDEAEAWDLDADEEAVRDELAVGRLLEGSPEEQAS